MFLTEEEKQESLLQIKTRLVRELVDQGFIEETVAKAGVQAAHDENLDYDEIHSWCLEYGFESCVIEKYFDEYEKSVGTFQM